MPFGHLSIISIIYSRSPAQVCRSPGRKTLERIRCCLLIWESMKTKPISIALAACLALGNALYAGPTKTYQVTGPILEMNDEMIAVQKGKDRWEIARNASTKADGAMKVGDKVTITYTMSAINVEATAGKGDSASPAAAPKK